MSEAGGFSSMASKLAFTMLAMLAAVAAAWTGISGVRYAKERKAVLEDEKVVREIAEFVPKVKGLAEAGYTEERLREERQTGQWTTFFASAAGASDFAGNQYRLPAMKTLKGSGYNEHSFEIAINPKTGVTRKMIVQFLWTIESRRTYLKTRSIGLKRNGDADDWGGTVTVAYREKP
jgi:hypothetical protein